jgi:hypothetical protein
MVALAPGLRQTIDHSSFGEMGRQESELRKVRMSMRFSS